MISYIVGMASGLGNCVHLLPAIKALKLMGNRVSAFVQTDFPTAELWKRCRYLDDVQEQPPSDNGARAVCGTWRPPGWAKNTNVRCYPLPSIHACEWRSNFRIAIDAGWKGEAPDMSGWCRGLEREIKYDIGIIPGCKGGTWLRKRYPGMAAVASHFTRAGRSVAIFGQANDGIADLPGKYVATPRIETLPDALAGCRVIIGTDSGPTFLASSLGIPVVMIYTATSEKKAEPVGPHRAVFTNVPCRPCVSTAKWRSCSNWICQKIEPDDVIKATEAFCGS